MSADQPIATPVTERETFKSEEMRKMGEFPYAFTLGQQALAQRMLRFAASRLEADRREGTGAGGKHLRNATDSVGWLDTTGPTSRVPRPDSGPRETGSSDELSASGDGSSGPECVWTQDDMGNWHTACGHSRFFAIGSPRKNKWEWCPYCGKPLKEAK